MSDGGMPEFLTQADIDRLMAEALEAPKQTVFRHDGSKHPDGTQVPIESFDFRTPVFLAETELRRLRIIHQEFIRTLSARFSAFLRADLNLKMSKLTTLPYNKFTDSVQNPSHLTLFKIDPLPGVGVIEVQPRLAMAMANRMLGGKGIAGESGRYLTEIEVALIEDVIHIIIDEWCLQWPGETNLAGAMLGHETNPRFLQTCAKDTVTLALAMEAVLGDGVEQIQIGVPYTMLEPLLKKMQAARIRETEQEKKARPQWRPTYDHIDVPVVADWVVSGLTLQDVLRLRLGDVIEMPRTAIDSTRIRLASKPQFLGRAGSEDGRVAVQINDRTKSSK
jgi:flagellar motor switch protein FliM